MTNLPTPTDGKCPSCGNTTLTLAVDFSRYQDVTCVGGKLVASDAYREEEMDVPEVRRLFCSECGEYFVVPEELT